MPDPNTSTITAGGQNVRRLLKETAVLQFAVGVSVAIAAVGLARGGRDTWFGVALVVFAAIFALRAYRLTLDAHELQASQERARLDELRSALQPPPPPAPPSPRRAPRRRRARLWSLR